MLAAQLIAEIRVWEARVCNLKCLRGQSATLECCYHGKRYTHNLSLSIYVYGGGGGAGNQIPITLCSVDYLTGASAMAITIIVGASAVGYNHHRVHVLPIYI